VVTVQQRGARQWVLALEQNIVVRLLAYYTTLGLVATLCWWLVPAGLRDLIASTMAELRSANLADVLDMNSRGRPRVDPAALTSHSAVLTTGIAVTAAFLLALPVAWVYMFTRQKRGYRQSVVQSLILLPVTVAGVVVLVKNSLALAFSLAGIVAAVRFRNTLEDSKDAVFIFAVTGLGLATAVHIDVAVLFSILFSAIVLSLWYSDFARTPPRLEAARAERHLERAMALANRTSQFVAQIDREVLGAMAPEQLDALAVRLRRHQDQMTEESGEAKLPKFDNRIRIHCSDGQGARSLLESVLERQVKRWQYENLELAGDGSEVVVYLVRFRKSVGPHSVVEALSREGAPFVVHVELAPVEAGG